MPRLELHEGVTTQVSVRVYIGGQTFGVHTKTREAMMYKPSVATMDMTIFRNIAFANSDDGLSGSCECITLSTPLNARKNAAN